MLKIYLLGPLLITLDDQPVTNFVSDKARALLCYLAVTRQVHSREAILGLLWGEDEEDKAKNSLRVALANVRKLLPGVIQATRQTVQLDSAAAYWLDLDDFRLPFADVPDEPMNTAVWRQTSDLYRGEFLQDFQMEGMPAFYEWVLGQRAYWNKQALALLNGLAEKQLAAGAYAQSAATLHRLLEIEPWQESAHRQLMLALSSMGDYNAALVQYESCRQVLNAELGVQPAADTEALYQRILAARAGRPHNLPAADTPFIGRQDEIKRIQAMLLNSDARLVTITGIGGLGKTRLALSAARAIQEGAGLLFSGGVTYVPLQGVEAANSAADALATAVASALKLFLPGRRPPAEEVLEYLEPEEQLLVFDNFESLLEGAPWLGEILKRCPQIKLLVTSREPLNLAAEWRITLEGLPYPALTGRAPALSRPVEDFEAVQLFLQAARQVRPGYKLTTENQEAVARICQEVMGMPLAIKLVAFWLRVMPTERLHQELQRNLDILQTRQRDVPARQRSMRAVFDSTWVMLSAEEQHVLSGLSVFRGGFAANAAQVLASASPFLLAGLQDRGLLQVEAAQQRYVLHELVRQFAAEKLAQDGDRMQKTHAAHSHYFGEFLGEQVPKLVSEKIAVGLSAIDREISNVRAGWRWAMRTEDNEDLPELAHYGRALRIYYTRRGLYHEGMAMVQALIERIDPHKAGPLTRPMRELQGAANLWQGLFHYVLGELATAEFYFEQSIAILAAQDEAVPFTRVDLAGANHMLGEVQVDTGHYQAAKAAFSKAEWLDASLGSTGYAAKSAAFIGLIDFALGNYAAAEENLSQTVLVLQQYNDFFYSALALGCLAQVRSVLGKSGAEGLQKLRANLEGSRALKSPVAIGLTLLNLGTALCLQGGSAVGEAAECLEESRQIFSKVNAPIHLPWVYYWLGHTRLLSGETATAADMFQTSLHMGYEQGMLPVLIDSLLGLAILVKQGRPESLTNSQIEAILTLVVYHPAAKASTKQRAREMAEDYQLLVSDPATAELAQIPGRLARELARGTAAPVFKRQGGYNLI